MNMSKTGSGYDTRQSVASDGEVCLATNFRKPVTVVLFLCGYIPLLAAVSVQRCKH